MEGQPGVTQGLSPFKKWAAVIVHLSRAQLLLGNTVQGTEAELGHSRFEGSHIIRSGWPCAQAQSGGAILALAGNFTHEMAQPACPHSLMRKLRLRKLQQPDAFSALIRTRATPQASCASDEVRHHRQCDIHG